MNITSLVAEQVFIMLVLILIGFAFTKKGLITKAGTKDISAILLTIVTPCVLIKAYQIDYSSEIVRELLMSFVLSILIHIVFIVLSYILCRYEKNSEKRISIIFTCAYSNCGFMGIPLLAATLGDKGVLLGSAYLATFNVLVWTHGYCMYGRSIKYLSLKNLIKNPGVIGVCLALVLFFTRIRIQGPLKDIVGYCASLNTPLAMFLLGTYLARNNFKKAVAESGIYIVTIIKLIVFPLIAVFLFCLIGTDSFLATTLVLSAACPAAAISPIFAEKFDMDTGYPSQIVSVTTLISILTIPLVSYAASFLIR